MYDNSHIRSLSDPAGEVTQHVTPLERCTRGRPRQTFHKHFESADQLFSIGVWECEVGSFAVNFTGHEFASLLEGRIMIEDEHGAQLHFVPGMQLVFPAGYKGVWNVLEPAKKSYVWHELSPPPL